MSKDEKVNKHTHKRKITKKQQDRSCSYPLQGVIKQFTVTDTSKEIHRKKNLQN